MWPIAILVALAALSWSTFALETPVKTCCPPGQFLAIEDWQDSQQSVEGIWYSQNPADVERFQHSVYHNWLPMMQVNNWDLAPDLNPVRHGRHYYITRVSCVPNEKNLPPIDGYRRSSDSSLPQFATWDDRKNNRKLFSNRSHPLAEGQMLKSTGHQLPSCPIQALSTMVLGDGRSNGFIDHPKNHYSYYGTSVYAYSSAFLRINATGHLVGQHMDQIGLSNLRMGRELPGPGPESRKDQDQEYQEYQDYQDYQDQELAGPRLQPQLPPPADETGLGVDFCLTWSSDPRISTTTVADLGLEFDPSEEKPFDEYVKDGGPLNLLEAVYCDPCKAKVVCSLVTKDIWPMLRPFIDPSFGPEDPKDIGRPGYQYNPNNPYLWFLIPYLDTDNDGKVSVWELYHLRVVQILRSIFDGLDVDGNGVLEKSEAIPENFFRPKFIRNVIAEIFKLADRNKDGFLSMDDVPLLNGEEKLNEPEELCFFLYWRRDAQECKNQISTHGPLLDVNGDSQLSLAEIQDPLIRLVQFLMGQPGKLVGVEEIVSVLEKLGESPEVTNPLRQYLRPVLATLPMKILQEIVASGDLDVDGGLSWEEFEGFGNFEFVANWFGYALCTRGSGGQGCLDWEKGIDKEVKRLQAGMEVCEHKTRTEKTCFPASANHPHFRRYISEPEVLKRLLQNLLFHKDFLFPSWQE